MDRTGFSETIVPIYQIAWRHIPEDRNLNIHCHEDPKYQ
jgi:hypothetical protein